jgi:hypothetical protein
MSVHSDPDFAVKPLVCAGSTQFTTMLWIRIRSHPKLLAGSSGFDMNLK